jgi:hypothetical protein
MFGGLVSLPDGGTASISETWEWQNGTWTKHNPIGTPSMNHSYAMAYDAARKRVVLFGGSKPNYSGPTNDTWEYDGTAWALRQPNAVPSPRNGACMAYDSARRVSVLFGGSLDAPTNSVANDSWEWDGNVWRQGPSGPPARRSCVMAYDQARGAIVLFGGNPNAHARGALGDTWVYY